MLTGIFHSVQPLIQLWIKGYNNVRNVFFKKKLKKPNFIQLVIGQCKKAVVFLWSNLDFF